MEKIIKNRQNRGSYLQHNFDCHLLTRYEKEKGKKNNINNTNNQSESFCADSTFIKSEKRKKMKKNEYMRSNQKN